MSRMVSPLTPETIYTSSVRSMTHTAARFQRSLHRHPVRAVVWCLAVVALLIALPITALAQAAYLGAVRSLGATAQGANASVAADGAGNTYIYEPNATTPQVRKIAPDGTISVFLTATDNFHPGASGSQMTFDVTSGRLFIPDPDNNQIYVATGAHAVALLPVNAGNFLFKPTSVLVTAQGTFILELAHLLQYSNGNLTDLAITDPDHNGNLTAMAYQPATGQLVILNTSSSSELFTYKISTGVSTRLFDTNHPPSGLPFSFTPGATSIAADPAGNLWIGTQGTTRLFEMQFDGGFNGSFDAVGPPFTYSSLAYTRTGSLASIATADQAIALINNQFVDLGNAPAGQSKLYVHPAGGGIAELKKG